MLNLSPILRVSQALRRSTSVPAPRITGGSDFSIEARRRARPSRRHLLRRLEEMEGRALMTAIPVFTTVNAPLAGGTLVPTAPMQQTVIDGSFAQNAWWSSPEQVNLASGELVTVSAQAASIYGSPTPDGLYVQAPGGSWVANPTTAATSTTSNSPAARTEARFRRTNLRSR